MRIQHNIMAMNAYRNYNLNNKALSGNLEKLSSGYKINRAGDDAAGLAISEKMRAQITGLNAAQKNVKDGISLVKTAEGAMQEIQDMLNRMDYLATQSANGTYQDEVDRENLQKEVNNLKTEINRIADSANFNGIKLLDGSLQDGSTAKTDALAAAEAAQKAADDALAAAPDAAATVAPTITNSTIATNRLLPTDATNDPANVDTKTIVESDYKDGGKPGFAIDFDGIQHVFKNVNSTSTTAGEYLNIKIGDVDVKITEQAIATAYAAVNGTTATNGDVADGKVLAKALETAWNAGTGGNDYTPDAGDVHKYTAVAQDGKTVFEKKDTDTTELTRHYDVKISGVTGSAADATKSVYTTGDYTAGKQGLDAGGAVYHLTNAKLSATVTINGKEYTTKEDTTGVANNAKVADLKTAYGNLEIDVTNDDGTTETKKLSDYFTVDVSGNKLTFTSNNKGADADKVTNVTFTAGTTPDTVTGTPIQAAAAASLAAAADNALVEGKDAYTSGTTGYANAGTEVTVQAGVPAIDQLASTSITLTADEVADGKSITLGDQTYVFAVGADSKYKDLDNAVYVEGLAADDTDFLDKMVTKLAEKAADNTTFTVSHRGTDGQIGLKQKQDVKDSTDMTTIDKIASYIKLGGVDTAATEAAQAEAVKAAEAEAAKLQEEADKLKAAAEKAVDGEALTLQIGDTSDDFNQMKVSVGDMHVSAMGTEGGAKISDIDIGTQKGAQEAVDVIKNAINYVSSVRGDLGAIQNRLDHTANNLSVMAENIQDAESTIRDTDVAEEMMSYVKNNILVQSAQAMLAQANQVPQGVLQLLG